MKELRKLLVAVDLHAPSAEHILSGVRELAPSAAVELIHVLEQPIVFGLGDPGGMATDNLQGQMRREASTYLQDLATRYACERWQLLDGHAATAIQQYAEESACDLIVLGTHGRHGIRRLLGSTANALLQGTQHDVLAIRVPEGGTACASGKERFRRILAAVDLSGESSQVLDVAHALSQREVAEFDLVHVVKPFRHTYAGINPTLLADVGVRFEQEADREARKLMRELAKRYDLPEGSTHVRLGKPAHEIHALIEELGVDLLVIGSHGKHGVQLLLGSVANAVIHGLECDVLAVRIR